MTSRRLPRDTSLSCPVCGFTTGLKTAGQAARSLRLHSCDHQRALQARAARVEARRSQVGPVIDCTHPVARHQHGTRAAYTLDHCRCRPCKDAQCAAEKIRVKQIAYGRWRPFVDAAPVLQHVRALMAAGMGWKRVAAAAGVSPSTVSKLLYGKAQAGPSLKMRAHTASRLLAVELDVAAGTFVPAAGTQRRLRALACLGWSDTLLAYRLGMTLANYGTLCNLQTHVTTRRAAQVRALYDDLWDRQPPNATRAERATVTRTLKRAAAAGWVSPLAWDDDTIDDPNARPAGVEGGMADRRTRLVEDVTELVAQGATVSAACARLGKHRSNLEKTLRRAGRADLWAALTGHAPTSARGTEATA